MVLGRQLRHAEPGRALSDTAQRELASREPHVSISRFIRMLPLKESCAVTCTNLLSSLRMGPAPQLICISDRPRRSRFERGEGSAYRRLRVAISSANCPPTESRGIFPLWPKAVLKAIIGEITILAVSHFPPFATSCDIILPVKILKSLALQQLAHRLVGLLELWLLYGHRVEVVQTLRSRAYEGCPLLVV
jgi:hypothetical protein